jgi:hypothetical protein
MGEVYLAQHPPLPRRDALKVLLQAMTADSEFRERFNREADLCRPHLQTRGGRAGAGDGCASKHPDPVWSLMAMASHRLPDDRRIQMDIETMPRGGFDASWLDRRLQTDRLAYLDRDDVDDRIKRKVIGSLYRMERVYRDLDHQAERTLKLVADNPNPKILELGAGHGGLSRKLLEMHPTVHVTVTDIDPISVSNIASGDLGSHPRAVVRQMDATDIDAPDRSYDLALFVLSFHHLRPALAARAMAEGTRAANKLLIVDLGRPPALLHLIGLVLFFPFAAVLPVAHDGLIGSLRAYSPSGFRALAAHADPTIDVEFSRLGRKFSRQGLNQVVVAQRRRPRFES